MVHDPEDPDAIEAGSEEASALRVPDSEAPVVAQPALHAPFRPVIALPALHVPGSIVATSRSVCPKKAPEPAVASTKIVCLDFNKPKGCKRSRCDHLHSLKRGRAVGGGRTVIIAMMYSRRWWSRHLEMFAISGHRTCSSMHLRATTSSTRRAHSTGAARTMLP